MWGRKLLIQWIATVIDEGMGSCMSIHLTYGLTKATKSPERKWILWYNNTSSSILYISRAKNFAYKSLGTRTMCIGRGGGGGVRGGGVWGTDGLLLLSKSTYVRK